MTMDLIHEQYYLMRLIDGLKEFMDSDEFNKLTGPEKCAITYQLEHMNGYLGMLNIRISML